MDRQALQQLLSGAVEAAVAHLGEALAAAPPAGPVFMVPIADLKVAPQTYQFRVSPLLSSAGTDGRLKACTRFRRELAGVALVWREPGGDLALLDGHHRFELARRSGIADLACLEVEAANARQARRIGALSNLAAGNATAADVAKLLRDEALSPAEVAAFGVSPRSKVLKDAGALLPLDRGLFAKVATGEVPLEMGLALAAAGPPAVQRELWREATRRNWSAAQVAEAASLAAMARVTSTAAAGVLPGLEAMLAGESTDLSALLAVRAAIKRQLGTELRALRAVSHRRSAAALEAADVAVIDVSAAAEARDSSRAQTRILHLLAGQSGPLQREIRRLADLVAAGQPAAAAVAENLSSVRRAIEEELSGLTG